MEPQQVYNQLLISILVDEYVWRIVAIGKTGKVGGVNSYVATPTGDYPKDTAVLFLSDIFGYTMSNSQVRIRIYKGWCVDHLYPRTNLQLLADDFADNGFKVNTSTWNIV